MPQCTHPTLPPRNLDPVYFLFRYHTAPKLYISLDNQTNDTHSPTIIPNYTIQPNISDFQTHQHHYHSQQHTILHSLIFYFPLIMPAPSRLSLKQSFQTHWIISDSETDLMVDAGFQALPGINWVRCIYCDTNLCGTAQSILKEHTINDCLNTRITNSISPQIQPSSSLQDIPPTSPPPRPPTPYIRPATPRLALPSTSTLSEQSLNSSIPDPIPIHQLPLHYKSIIERINSFRTAHISFQLCQEELAISGFYYYNNAIQCFSCTLQTVALPTHLEIDEFHAANSPSCHHVTEMKGIPFIRVALKLHKTTTELKRDLSLLHNQIKKLKRKNSQGLCLICADKTADFALIPCGHVCFCATCIRALNHNLCPICRKDSTQSIRILTIPETF